MATTTGAATLAETSASGDNATTTDPGGLSTTEIIIIAVVCGAVGLIIIAILIYCLIKKVQYKRSGEGKYSPSDNENKSGVRMDDMMTVIQPPPPERLI